MKVLAFVGIVMATTLAFVGSMVLVVLATPDAEPVWAGIAGGAIGVLLYAGFVLGSLRAYWDVGGSEESRVVYRRWWIGTIIAEGAAGIVLVVHTVVTGAPPWIPVLFICTGAGLTVVAPRAGAAFRRRERKLQHPSLQAVDDADRIRRKLRGMGITLAVAFVIAAIGLLAIDLALGGRLDDIGMLVLTAASLALFAAAIAGIIGSVSISRRLRSLASDDLGRARRFGRAVFRGKEEDFTEAEHVAVLEYARLSLLGFRLQITTFGSLYAGVALQQTTMILLRPDDALLNVVVLVALGIVFLAAIPLLMQQARRGRRFIATHGGGHVTVPA